MPEMKVSIRTVIVTSIPTLVALLGFLWFRKKKKSPAIKAKNSDAAKPVIKAKSAIKQEIVSLPTATACKGNIVKEEQEPLQTPTNIGVKSNNNGKVPTSSSSAASSTLSASPVSSHTAKMVTENCNVISQIIVSAIATESSTSQEEYHVTEDDIRVEIVNPVKSIPKFETHKATHSPVEVESVVSDDSSVSSAPPMVNGNDQLLEDTVEDSEITVSQLQHCNNSVTVIEPKNVSNAIKCPDSKESLAPLQQQQQQSSMSSVTVNGANCQGKVNVEVPMREGSHDSAVSMSSPIGTPLDSEVNGVVTNSNCDAHSEVSNTQISSAIRGITIITL